LALPTGIGATKKPGVLFVTPGFVSSRRLKADVTCAGDTGILRHANLYSPDYRQRDAGSGGAGCVARRSADMAQPPVPL